ncbi:hypothetical protein MLD38_011685 [Melastoma candidum]|uniref:Uncharacterized protein n=1 Tax=Melastoma candidum TaxID=119954 RepID=A0ACB9R5L5_9MYRT|nr:hypothetical protein MLD38_011685 [Melastoma candidum]
MAAAQGEQLNEIRDIFTRFDMDSDGSLTILELKALLHSNGNGLVEFNELVNVMMPNMKEEVLVNQRQLLEVFRMFDRDGNGYITAVELAGTMAKMGQQGRQLGFPHRMGTSGLNLTSVGYVKKSC